MVFHNAAEMCFALRKTAAPPILSISAPSLSDLPPSPTRPNINDTAIWGSGSSPALYPSCRLRLNQQDTGHTFT